MVNRPEPAETTDLDVAERLLHLSVTKQAKLREIVALLGPLDDGAEALDVGGDNGLVSWRLRRQGGMWISADGSEKAVEAIRRLVGGTVERLEGAQLPFADGRFDAVVIIDYLEHVEDDQGFVAECHRVLKPGGRLIVNVPHAKPLAVLRPLRRLLGQTDARHGHVRPGYTEAQLFAILKDGFDVQEVRTYSRFFVELLDTFVRLATQRSTRADADDAKGALFAVDDARRASKMLRAGSLLYPFFRLAEWMDRLLFFTRGYSLIVSAVRRTWRPRVAPSLRDGRSIAEAALQGKIGTAAPF